jgi:hypothetical protein
MAMLHRWGLDLVVDTGLDVADSSNLSASTAATVSKHLQAVRHRPEALRGSWPARMRSGGGPLGPGPEEAFGPLPHRERQIAPIVRCGLLTDADDEKVRRVPDNKAR